MKMRVQQSEYSLRGSARVSFLILLMPQYLTTAFVSFATRT